jgi:exopolysaccharide/PEP-CTERM locus tyrosine autokinase
MSLIERALERLKQEAAARKEHVQAAPVLPAAAAPLVESARPVATAGDSRSAQPLPHRKDRSVSIDLTALRAAGAIAPATEERRLAEEYRIIKRPLLKAMTQGEPSELRNVVAVTSALPGEGKTFTSVNLALSLALERDREVVLVDGDVAKRHVTHLFRLDGEPGLLDSASDAHSALASTLIKTDLPSLYLLPAGTPHSEATEILRSERTAALLAALASDPRRIVLIDCSPLLVTSEAGVLAALAGQVVVVVKASDTPQEVVVRAVEAVTEDKPVRLILNQVLSAPEHHYGYYYGGYGYGYKYGEKDVGSKAQDDRG